MNCLSVSCAAYDRTLRRFTYDPDVRYVDSRSKFVSSTLPHARLHRQTAQRTCCNHWDPRRAVSERTRDKLVSEPSDGPVKRAFEDLQPKTEDGVPPAGTRIAQRLLRGRLRQPAEDPRPDPIGRCEDHRLCFGDAVGLDLQ